MEEEATGEVLNAYSTWNQTYRLLKFSQSPKYLTLSRAIKKYYTYNNGRLSLELSFGKRLAMTEVD